MKIQPQEKIVLLGASSGLGLAVESLLARRTEEVSLSSFSRKKGGMDFSKRELWTEHFKKIAELEMDRVLYFAGGGPFGNFENFEWKDHEWALNVSFLFPAFLLSSFLKLAHEGYPLKQIVFVGSAIAEKKPDPQAAMYCAAKHALRGLISSVQLEKPQIDLRLFSPGYMQTALLPQKSWPRLKGLAQKVEPVAEEFVDFMTQPGPKLISNSID